MAAPPPDLPTAHSMDTEWFAIAAPLRVEALATELRWRLGKVHLAGFDFTRDADVRPNASLPTRHWE